MSLIGHVVATESSPNTAYSFRFWADQKCRIGIGTVIRAEYADTKVFGIVVQAYAYNDVPGAMADFLGREGRPDMTPPTARPEVRLYEAAVLRRMPEEPVGAIGIGPVFEATEEDLNDALGAGKYRDRGIPIGVYGSKANPMAVYADPEFLLGPEAGHLNVTGTSGLAAKTSYILFLLTSIFQRFRGEGGEGVATVLFNVKGGDLLFLDHETQSPLDEEHRRMYSVCGLDPKPFTNVHYCAPFKDEAKEVVDSLRTHEDFKNSPTSGFCFGLSEALEHAEVLLNRDDLDAKADAFLQFLRKVAANEEKLILEGTQATFRTLREMLACIQKMLDEAKANNETTFQSHHVATIRKMHNRLSGFLMRFPGLISAGGDPVPALPEAFDDRHIYVIDVSRMASDAQDLVFASVIGKLREKMELGRLGVRRLIVAVDELNKYAPSGGRDTYVVQSLRDIAARGRYLGLTLFGAQQFRSKVDAQIVGNAANSAYGHIQLEELTNSIYTVYPAAIREKLASASPGEMMVRHPHFSQPIFIKFPIPPVLKGSDGMARWPAKVVERIEDRIVRLAVVRDPELKPHEIWAHLDQVTTPDRPAILHRVEQQIGSGDAPREVLRRLGKLAPQQVTGQYPADADDPFA